MPNFKIGVAGTAASALLLLLTSCGADEPGASAQDAGESSGAFPVTVTTALGEVEIPEEPQRIVTLDFPSTDALLALGEVPVAMAEVTYVDDGVQEWTKTALDGEEPEIFNADVDIPIEQIAALDPDLILGAGSYNLEPAYDKLSQIAPVVAWETAAGNDSWQQLTLNVAKALGREADGEALVEETEAAVAEAREVNPALEGETVGIFNFVEQPYLINSRDDSSIKFFESLGMVLPPEVESLPGTDARATLSLENLDPLDTDVLIGTSGNGTLAQLEESTLFQGLDVVQRDAYLSLDIGAATSMAFPSALSVQWALDNVVPDVVEAAER